ncbi:MAG TPA: class I SAM-dependent methyltransferase [Chitinispirillaceae bacterium]|nr:class I SAM-dependent methyltransferase [Chitinispirillaceae bacterium]
MSVSKTLANVVLANQLDNKPYEIAVFGKSFIVYPRVYSPKYCKDTAFYAQELPVKAGDKVLEIGCGTGVVSIFALFKGADSVVAIDINPLAVQNARENAQRYGFEHQMEIRQSDVWEKINTYETFDLIFWNIPFGYSDNNLATIEEKAVFDPGYNAIRRFFGGAACHMGECSRLMFGCCPELMRFDLLLNIVNEADFTFSTFSGQVIKNFDGIINLVLFEAFKNVNA